MSSALYIFRLVWPFLKELVLGGLTLKEGMRTNKRRVFLLFFVSGMMFLLFLIIPRFYLLTQEHNKLEKSVEAGNVSRLEQRIKELEALFNSPPGNSNAVQVAGKDKETAPPPPPDPAPKETAVAKAEPPKHPAAPRGPVTPAKKSEDPPTDRKKSYMEFFEQYDE